MNYSHKLILFLFIIYLPKGVSSQELSSDLQEVVKSFEAQLEEANKVKINPVIVPNLPVKKKYLYNITIVPLEIKYPEPTIKPISTEPDLPFDNKLFLFKAGYGNVKNPKVDLQYYKSDQNKIDYYLSGHYYGLDNSAHVINQKFNDTEVGIGAKLRLKENHQIELNSKGDLENRNLYFIYDQINSDQKRHRLNISSDVCIRNIEHLSSDIDYKVKLGHSMLKLSNSDVVETKAMMHAEVSKVKDNFLVRFPISMSGVLQKNISDLYSINFSPYLQLGSDKFLFRGGLGMSYDSEIKASKIWPIILADYAIGGKKFHGFVESNQLQIANDLHFLSSVNPYINSNLSMLTNSLVQTAAIGIRGETLSIAYQGQLSYNIHNNFVYYTNIDSLLTSFSEAKFEKVNYIQLKLSTDFAVSNTISVGGYLTKNFYDSPDNVSLYGINTLEVNANAKIKMIKGKFVLKPLLTVRDRANALVLNNKFQQEIQLNNQVDLSVHTDIVLGKIGLYAEANNVLNNKYSRWYGYPNVGINFNGGIILRL